MLVDRLSPLDEAFLRIESDAAHMHVGWTLLAEGEPPATEELREHVARRLDFLPRFRCRPLTSVLHDPMWVDHREFDLCYHVTRESVPPPGGEEELRAFAGALLSEPLDRRRPLWRMHVVDGLRDGGFAILGRAHHALVDGVSAVERLRQQLPRERAQLRLAAGARQRFARDVVAEIKLAVVDPHRVV